VADYRELADHSVAWCGDNHLIFNVNKTKEMIVDFRRTRNQPDTWGKRWRWWKTTNSWLFSCTVEQTEVGMQH